jgi:hypothetical protein
MHLRRYSSVCALLLAALLAPGVARAQASDEDKGTARALLIEGNEAFEKRDYAHALSCFERADALFHAPTILIGLARSRAALGKLVGAREAYNRLINEPVTPNLSPAFLKAIEDARTEVLAITARVPAIVINIQGADVSKVIATMDGAAIPNAALGAKRPADPGRHVIRVGGPGLETTELVVTIGEGKTETVTVPMKEGEGTPPVATPAAPMLAGVAPGLTAGGAVAETGSGSGGTLTTLGYVSLGVGAAGLIAGGVAGGLAIAKRSDITGNGQCPNGLCPASASSDVSTYNTLGAISTAGFIAGGVLAAGGAVLIFTAPKKAQTAMITPTVGLGTFGVRGTF